jgi:hypothetical protein
MCEKHQFETRNEIYTVIILFSTTHLKNKNDLKCILN